MKTILMRAAVFAGVCGGAVIAAGHAAITARLATNHCEPTISAE